MSRPLEGKVALVTGATRGVGKGIALQLGQAGAKVYITGRTLTQTKGCVRGSLEETKTEIEARGGKVVAVQCDSTNDDDIKALFDRINGDNDGQLDILVNNANSAVDMMLSNIGIPFWEQPLEIWDLVTRSSVRSDYICSVYAAKMMVPRKRGLIVNLSSPGGLSYIFGVAYGTEKEAVDRLSVDCGLELREHNVCAVSLWPGAVRTELATEKLIPEGNMRHVPHFEQLFLNGESIEFPGKAVVGLANDKNMMSKSGRVLMTGDLAEEYKFMDIDGRRIRPWRNLKFQLTVYGFNRIARFTPEFINVPCWLYSFLGHKF